MSLILLALGCAVVAVIFRLSWRVVPMSFLIYWAVALIAHVLLPADHPICLWFGGSWQSWAATGSIALVIAIYVLVVVKLKRSARQVGP